MGLGSLAPVAVILQHLDRKSSFLTGVRKVEGKSFVQYPAAEEPARTHGTSVLTAGTTASAGEWFGTLLDW